MLLYPNIKYILDILMSENVTKIEINNKTVISY